jgi:imidazolonepropionase-like amidohydrolase
MSNHSDILYQKNGKTHSVPVTLIEFHNGEAAYRDQQLIIENGSITETQSAAGSADFFVTSGFINCHMHWLMNGDSGPFEAMLEEIAGNPDRAREKAIDHARSTLKLGITFGGDKGPPGLCGAPVYRGMMEAIAGGVPMTGTIFSTWTFMAAGSFGEPYARMIHSLKEMQVALLELGASGAGVGKFIPESPFIQDKEGYDFVFPGEWFQYARSVAREKNWVFAVHAKGTETLEQCIRVGADCVEHGVQASADQLKAFQEKNIYLGPTLDGLLCRLEHAQKTRQKLPETTYEWEAVCRMVRTAAALNDGRPFTHMLFSSDAGSYTTPHASLRELYLLRKTGWDPAPVFEAATVNGARCLKRNNRGAVKKGMKADLIFWSQNPLELPLEQWQHLENHIAAVVLNGRVVARD